MFSTTLNGQRILYGAEMDGIESDHSYDLNDVDLNQLNFVELKVKIREQNHRQKQNYHRFKLRNWWYVIIRHYKIFFCFLRIIFWLILSLSLIIFFQYYSG